MAYPQKLYRNDGPDAVVVNSDAEAAAAAKDGYHVEPPARQEYPKVVYLIPVDKTKEHVALVVNNPEEEKAAAAKGYQRKPHVAVAAPDKGFVTAPASPAPVAAQPAALKPQSPAPVVAPSPVVPEPVPEGAK